MKIRALNELYLYVGFKYKNEYLDIIYEIVNINNDELFLTSDEIGHPSYTIYKDQLEKALKTNSKKIYQIK